MRVVSLLAIFTIIAMTFVRASANEFVDWRQGLVSAQDASVSHDGQKWIIGSDGAAYQWDEVTNNWSNISGRNDFVRIDAGPDGVAAIAKNGSLYIKGQGSGWQPTGIYAQDIGIGAGQVWLAGARNIQGGLITLSGAFEGTAKIDWTAVKGTLERIDVDPQGRPWGIDKAGRVFVYANDVWLEDTKAPQASDIGVGGDGSIYIAGAEIDRNLGGGRVYLRDAETGDWSARPGRLSAISVTPDGRAFGANTLNWLITATAEGSPATEEQDVNLPDPSVFKKESEKTLADILGTAVPGADKIKLSKVEIIEDTIAGTAELNGSPVRALLHQPDPKETVLIAGLEHQSVDLGTYIPKIRNTDLGSFGLLNAIFYVQPEGADKIEYATFDDMPAPLSSLVTKQQDYKDLFPLTIHPGVTVIDTLNPSNNNAKAVMKAYGMTEQGYVVKGHFKLSQLQNLSFDIPAAPRKPRNKKEACESTSSASLSGLDLTFPIPDFKPPYAQGAVSFSNASFSFKEIDGQIEPSVITGMTFNLPEAQIGIKNIPMVGKLAVRGDLNVLCSGINKETQGIVSFAASTTFNASDVDDIAIEALSKVTEDGAENPSNTGDLGWKKPFGLPFLNIRHYASSGVFEQKEENGALKRTLSTSVWADSVLDRATLDLFGTMDFDIKLDTLEVTDWSFETEGPIAFNDLPGLKDMPKVDEFALKDIALNPSEMTGTVLRQNKNLEAIAYLKREEQENAPDEFSAFVKFNTLRTSSIYDFLPKEADAMIFAPALIAWSNETTNELAYRDVPEALKPLLDNIIEEDDTITIAKGLTLAGKTTAKDIADGQLSRLLKDYVSFDGSIRMFGAFAGKQGGGMHGELRGILENFAIKNIPSSLVTFKDSEIRLSNTEGTAIEIETAANMQAPGENTLLDLKGTLTYEETTPLQNTLEVALSSDYLWNNPFKIPDLQVTNLGLDIALENNDGTSTEQISFTGDGVFRKQAGKVSIDFESMEGDPAFASVSFEGELKVSELLELPNGAEKVADATFRKLTLGTNAIGGDLAFNLNGLNFDGRGAAIFDDDGAALFLRQDSDLAIGKIVDDMPSPFNDLTIPKGLLIVSSRAIESFDAKTIPSAIYDDVIAGLVDQDQTEKLIVEEGVMFMTKILPSILPEPVPTVLETPFGVQDEMFIAGSVGGVFGTEPPSIGFYTILENVTPDMPDFVDNFVEFTNTDLKLFIRSTSAVAGSVDIGIENDAKIKMRRLDNPTIVQPKGGLDSTFAFTYSGGATGMSMTASANVKGDWADPLGLEGYSFQNPSIAFGVEEKGTTVSIHTDRADFKQNGTNKAFVFDLDTTWVSLAPTDLAVQFEKTKDTNELILTPLDLANVQKSIFDLVFRSGSNLGTAVSGKLGSAPKAVFDGFSSALSASSNGAFSLIEKSPLSMIGVRNPVLYFGTPGSTPPSHPDIDRPPLGLGLHVAGGFTVDTGMLKADLANGSYKVNLVDGYATSGSVSPPAPFSSNVMTVSGNMPLLGGPQHLSFNGKLEIPGASIAGISLGAEGTFDVRRGSLIDPNASVYADVSIGGILSRQFDMNLQGTSLSFDSPGGCTDIPPIDISGTVSLSGFSVESMTSTLLSAIKPIVPDPVACAGDLAELFTDIADGALDVVNDPIGSAEGVIDAAGSVGEALTNPEEAIKKAGEIAKMPLNTVEALSGLSDVGISVATAGIEKVPVLGPGAGKAVGDAYNKAKELKNFAMDKLSNNAVTGWMSDSFGAAAGAIGGAIGDVTGAIGSIWGSQSTPTWYRINPLRCKPRVHHWNPIFTQCFENGAVVLFDESSRTPDKLGECMRYVHDPLGSQLWVDTCHGDAFNQFHLDPVSNEIRTTKQSYWGYNGRWHGPGRPYPDCLIRNNRGIIALGACGGENAKWTYTEDMKLKQGNTCIDRGANNKLGMSLCSDATAWLGTSVAPNWNEVEQVPVRGRILHPATGRCLWWEHGGPYALADCGKQNVTPDDKFNMRTHTRLMVLDGNHTVAILGARAWDGEVKYGCMGLTSNAPGNTNVMARHCWPDLIYEESKWRVFAVLSDGTLDTNHTIPLKDTLKGYDYVFWNVHSQQCLKGSLTQAEAANSNSLAFINETMLCTDGSGRAMADVKFSGYEADDVASQVLVDAGRKAYRTMREDREKLKNNLQEWQRQRVLSENSRVKTAIKISNSAWSENNKARSNRKSPGHCSHGEFWNHALKVCAKDSRMSLKYHDSRGEFKGCFNFTTVNDVNTNLGDNCLVYKNDRYDRADLSSFLFDDKRRIIKRFFEGERKSYFGVDNLYWANDTCLTPKSKKNGQPILINGKRAVGFVTCGDDSLTWKYSPQGELVSNTDQCLRSEAYTVDEPPLINANYGPFMDEVNAFNKQAWKDYNEQVQVIHNTMQVDYNKYEEMEGRGEEVDWDAIDRPMRDAIAAAEKERDARIAAERVRLIEKHQPYDTSSDNKSYNDTFVLDDCNSDVMDAGKYRWIPNVGNDFTAQQDLPKTARITLASEPSMCVTASLGNADELTFLPCNDNNKDQYFALGGTDKEHFLISPRNSKTCVKKDLQNAVTHSICHFGAPEMFVKTDENNNTFKMRNAASDLCLAKDGSTVVQTICNNAPQFQFASVNSIDGISFSKQEDLQIGSAAHETPLVDAVKKRARLIYAGGYLQSNGRMLSKNSDDRPAMIPTVKDTRIVLLPGFSNGVNHITFSDHDVDASNPHTRAYDRVFSFVHFRKVMRVTDDNSVRFEFIEESDAFRNSASFKLIKSASGAEHLYSFESVSKPGMYLQARNGMLTLGSQKQDFLLESTMKWQSGGDQSKAPFPYWTNTVPDDAIPLR